MTSHPQTPTGLGRRSRRLSDEETERRMLEAAVARVNRTGLTVSLDHISFEDVIRDADVSRSSAYRRWPYKDLFFSDLLKELAKAASPGLAADEGTLELVRRVVLEHLDWLETPELRGRLVLELIRQAAPIDFASVYESREWRTYFALHATFLSLTDGALRDELRQVLATSEQGFITRVAGAWHYIAALFGYRLRAELGVSFETLASLLIANLRGLALMALSTPDLAMRRLRTKPAGAAEASDWSLTALGAASIATALFEPDPEFAWTAERRASIRESLEQAVLQGVVATGHGPRLKEAGSGEQAPNAHLDGVPGGAPGNE
jgi:AcrR family transcriptional regulator